MVLSWKLIFSVCLVLAGIYLLYCLKNSSSIRWNIVKFIFAMSAFLFLFTYFVVPGRPIVHHNFIPLMNHHSEKSQSIMIDDAPEVSFNFDEANISCDRISTAWMYQKAIPDSVVANIVAIANQNPSIPVHVYCGSKQCVEAIETRNRTNMVVKLAIVGDTVKGLSVLEDWLSRHPINKVIAGREFETHLQEVAIIGILWENGGVYVSPILKVSSDFRVTCQNTTPAWVVKNVSQLKGNLESILDISFFVRNHPFIHKLAHLYGHNYPTKRRDGNRRGFLTTMLLQNPCTAFCPRVLRDTPQIVSSDYSLIDPSQEIRHFGILSRNQPATVAGLDIRMQEFAMAHFLPFFNTFTDLDDLSSSSKKGDISVFLNGLGETEKWQPPSNMKPIMLSLHLQEVKHGSVAYLKEKEPIGCADSTTLDFLTNKNVSAFLSGSLMLLLSKPVSKEIINKRKGILLSNLDNEVIKLLPEEIQRGAIRLEQRRRDDLTSNDTITRFKATHQLLERYKAVNLVITQSFHSASACAAMGIAVIFIETADSSSSLATGMTSLFHTLDLHSKSNEQATQWLANFSWKDIPPNPGVDLLMKLRATAWNVIRQNQAFFDTAKKLGVIPMSPPRVLPEDEKLLFHMIHTSSSNSTLSTFSSKTRQSGAFNWRHWRSVESVFRHHPTSKVMFHSNTLSQRMFDVLTEVGYSIVVSPYDLEELLKGSPAESFLPELEPAMKGPYWVYTEADLTRLLFVYKWGGVYLDTDIYLVQPLDTLRENGAGWQDKNNGSLNNAFLYYEKQHPFVKNILETFTLTFDRSAWGSSGPHLVTKVWNRWKESHKHILNDKHTMQPYDHTAIYMLYWRTVKKDCFETIGGERFEEYMKLLHTQAYGVHINAKITGAIGTTGQEMKKGTLCSYILNEFCVLCDILY